MPGVGVGTSATTPAQAGPPATPRPKNGEINRGSREPISVAGQNPSSVGSEDALLAALERMERRVAGAMSRVRDSVVTLEYTAEDSPTGTRRVATGVVISPQGEILSIRIDRPMVPQTSTSTTTTPPPEATTARVSPGSAMADVSTISPSPIPGTGVGAGAAARGERMRTGSRAAGSSMPIFARDATGRRHVATWLAADPETGLTLLRIPPKLVRPVRIAADSPKLGSSVFVVGNPLGLGHSVSRGHVAGLDRALEIGPRQLGGLIQVQVPLYPGDSGATVANLRGEWLGLVRGGLAAATSASSLTPAQPVKGRDDDLDRNAELDHDHDIGFAIPARDAIWVADQLRNSGRVERAYLGVRLEPADPADVQGEGARLSEILANTPAAAAGLRTGDRIVALDSHAIRSPGDLTDRLDRTRAHTRIKLGVLRRRDPSRSGTATADDPRSDSTSNDPDLDRLDVTLQAASRPSETLPDPGPAGPGPELGAVVAPEGGTVAGASLGSEGVVRTASASGSESANATTPPAVSVRAMISKTSSSVANPQGALQVPEPNVGIVPLRPATVATAPTQASSASAPVPSPSTASSPSSSTTLRALPLESQGVPPHPAELEPISPRAVIERLERIERRIERIERRGDLPASSSSGPSGR